MAYRSSSINVNAAGTTNHTVAVPASVAIGDIVLLCLSIDNETASVSGWPSGFTALIADQNLAAPDGHSYAVAWKRLTAADSGNYSITSSVGAESRVIAVAFSGRHASDAPTHTNATNLNDNTSPVSVTATGVTAVQGDDLCFFGIADTSAADIATGWAAPSGFTERQDGTSGWAPATCATLDNVSAGATGDKTATLTLSSGTTQWGAVLVRIPVAEASSGIQYVGGTSGGRTGNSNATTTQSLTGLTGGIASAPAEGDLVIVACAVGSQGRNPAQAISGYTTLGTQLNPTAVTYDTSLQVSYKVQGATPDTQITIPAQGNVADGQAWVVQVFRGVDTTTPFDVSSVSATGTATGRPDPAAITPTTAGAWIVVGAAAAASATTTAFTAPTDFATNFTQNTGADTNDVRTAMGYYTGWTSGSYNPAQFTGGTTGTNDSWAAWTMALKPAAPITYKTFTFSGTGTNSLSRQAGLLRTFSGVGSIAKSIALSVSKAFDGTGTVSFVKSKLTDIIRTFDGTGTATLSRVSSFLRDFSFSGTASYVFEKVLVTYAGIKSVWPGWLTSVGAEQGATQYQKDLTFTGTGTAAFSRASTFLKDLVYAATAALALSKIASYVRSFSFNGVGTNALSRIYNYVRSFPYVATGTAEYSKLASYLRSLSVSGTATSVLTTVKAISRNLNYSAVGTYTLSRASNFLKSFTYSGVGTSVFSWMRVFLRNFTYTGVGTQVLSKQFQLLKSYAGTATSAFSRLATVFRSFNYTGTAGVAFSRMVGLLKTFTGLATVAFEKALTAGNQLYYKTLDYAASAASSLTKQVGLVKTFSATGALARLYAATHVVTRTFAGTGAVTKIRQISKSFAYAGTGSFAALKQAYKAFTYAGTAVVTYADAFLTSVTRTFTATASAVFSSITLPFNPSTFTRVMRRVLYKFLSRR